MCPSCEPFDSDVAIRGPAQLRRIIAKLQAAVGAGVFRCAPEAGQGLPAQPPFAQLDADALLPDVIGYTFTCQTCGAGFRLSVETYHGGGGQWSKL